jgi:hypothetical protein
VPDATAYHLAFLTAAGIAALALLLTVRISDTDAAPSMRRTEDPEPSLAVA